MFNTIDNRFAHLRQQIDALDASIERELVVMDRVKADREEYR
jgi:hypothetical protein